MITNQQAVEVDLVGFKAWYEKKYPKSSFPFWPTDTFTSDLSTKDGKVWVNAKIIGSAVPVRFVKVCK